MIIFDCDGTLADPTHRRHLVDPYIALKIPKGNHGDQTNQCFRNMIKEFKPDYPAFNELCDKDEPILSVIHIFNMLWNKGNVPIQIWSGRCESIRKKTEEWLYKHLDIDLALPVLKMRPIGDSTPDDQLKERWLDEYLATGGKVDFVVDDHPKVIRMWQRRGIFTFDVGQGKGEF